MKKIGYNWSRTLGRIAISLVGLLLLGCGGGSQGTGGQIYKGFVFGSDSQPINGATVRVVRTGDVASTNINGEFTIETFPISGDVEFQIVTDNFATSALLVGVPDDAIEIEVEIEVELEGNHGTSVNSSVKKRQSSSVTDGMVENDLNGNGSGEVDSDESDQADERRDRGNSHDPQFGVGEDDSQQVEDGADTEDGSNGNEEMENEDNENTGNGENIDSEGQVSVFSGNVITVGGVTFTLTAQTEYRDQFGHQATVAILFVGANVKVKGRVVAGSLVAERVELED